MVKIDQISFAVVVTRHCKSFSLCIMFDKNNSEYKNNAKYCCFKYRC